MVAPERTDGKVVACMSPARWKESPISSYFLGPISRFATGDEKPKTLLEFVRRWTGMKSNILQLVPAETPAVGAAAASSLNKTRPPVNLR